MKNNDEDFDPEITNENDLELELPELEEVEEQSADKLKKLRHKLSECEEEKRQLRDETQRIKADFLNARKRLEDERLRDRVRYRKEHVEELLPLCDSFEMAMSNKEVWEKADAAWRAGIEGIRTQLTTILDSYGVKAVSPQGETFDPYRHEAIGTEAVTDEALKDTIVSVVQKGYEITVDGETELIRPARVTTGIIN